LDERIAIDRGHAASACQRDRTGHLDDELASVGGGERQEAHCHLIEHLGEDATEPERHDQAERLAPHDAGEEFDACALALLLHQEPGRCEAMPGDLGGHVRQRVGELVGCDAEAHRADVGLVDDPAAERLDHQRTRQAGDVARADVSGVDRDGRGRRDTEAVQRRLHVGLRDDRASIAERERTTAVEGRVRH
jgi:hypothetical protein